MGQLLLMEDLKQSSGDRLICQSVIVRLRLNSKQLLQQLFSSPASRFFFSFLPVVSDT